MDRRQGFSVLSWVRVGDLSGCSISSWYVLIYFTKRRPRSQSSSSEIDVDSSKGNAGIGLLLGLGIGVASGFVLELGSG